jgi:hypothetical protein
MSDERTDKLIWGGVVGLGVVAWMWLADRDTGEPQRMTRSNGVLEQPLLDGVPPIVRDLDCSDFGGPVVVRGNDPHGLDRDNDGIGCESNG